MAAVAEDRLLSSKELAARIDVSVRTVQRWAEEGSLEPELVTPGGQYKWSEASVRQQLRARRGRRPADGDPTP